MTNIDRRALLKSAAGLAAAGGVAALGSPASAASPARAARPASTDGTLPAQGRRTFELIVVRHAESESNVRRDPNIPDEGFTYPLTLLGMNQAAHLARQLRGLDVSAVVSSTRLRTVQTADAIAFDQELQLQLAPELLEISLAGITNPAQAIAVINQWAAGNLDAKTPAGESLNEARARALPKFQALIEKYRDTPGKLVVVSHGATMFGVLPVVFSNVSLPFAVAHQPGNTGVIRGEFIDGELVCTDWLGLPPA